MKLKRYAMHARTGRYFSGTAFDAEEIENAQELPALIGEFDFKASWNIPVLIIEKA